MKYSVRIQGRAISRAGELLKEFDGRGDHRKSNGGDTSSQREAAASAGMSKRQQVTAVRVASVPKDFFERTMMADNARARVETKRPGGDRRSEDYHSIKRADGTNGLANQGSNNTQKLLRRIARERPEILSRYEAGASRSRRSRV